MAGFYAVDDVLHKIIVKLYPNHFHHVEGLYIAHTNNNSSLTIENVCASLKNRGGFSGDYGDLVKNVNQFFDEMAFLLCDGFAVNTGYFSIHPNIGGTFNSANESHDHTKNPISFRFRPRTKFRNLIDRIAVVIEGVADTSGCISGFLDYDENSVNAVFTPGNQFCITGHKIKIAGEDPSCGVYFVPADDPSKAVKVTRLAENNPTRITGIAPKTESVHNSIEIRTQYAGSGTYMLKTPRIITSNFVIEEV